VRLHYDDFRQPPFPIYNRRYAQYLFAGAVLGIQETVDDLEIGMVRDIIEHLRIEWVTRVPVLNSA
jgi:hypothetical protein